MISAVRYIALIGVTYLIRKAKMENEIVDRVTEIQKWCLENNSDDFTVFFDFHGHTKQVDVCIHSLGFSANNTPNFKSTVYLDDEKAEKLLFVLMCNIQAEKENSKSPGKRLKEAKAKLKAKRKSNSSEEQQLELIISELEGK